MDVRRFRSSWMLAALLSAHALAFSADDERYDLTIDRGSLAWALEQFSLQTGLQIGTQLNVSDSKTAEIGPFVGAGTADEAMTALLQGTDLSYTWQDEHTIRVFVIEIRPPRSEDDVQEVLVTDTRLPQVEDTPAPVRVYGRDSIEKYGVSSVAELASYFTQQLNSTNESYFQSGAQFFQMRGLGFDTTLVLINGRRVPPSANSISLNAVDLNNLPIMAVERIEVMPDSASAIYGADAVGGVINVILKDRIDKPQVYLHYGQAEGGGVQRRAAASLGAANDHIKSTLVLDYYDKTALMGSERELWSNQDYRRFGGLDYRVSATNPGNVYSLTGQPLPGLSSSRAAVPVSTTGPLSPAHFLDGATNLASSFNDTSITPPSRRATAYGSAEYSLAPELSLFAEVLAEDSELTALRPPPSVSRLIVPASNPFNPFGVPVAVDYAFAGMQPISHVYETDLLRLVGGARGMIGRGWEWEISGLHHGEDGVTTTRGEIDRFLLASAVYSDDPDHALNLFTVGPPATPELLNSLLSKPQQLDFSFSNSQLSSSLRGPLLYVGRRPAELVVGAEWRHEATDFLESGQRIDVSRDVTSVFAELRLPLLETLSLKIAARADDYGATEPIVNPQYGIVWRPAKDWLLRAAYGTSFRPPSLYELFTPTSRAEFLIADPLRAGEVSSVDVRVGGNRALEAVTAQSFSTGFVFNPAEMRELRVGGSYWRVVMNDRIMVPNYQELLKLESTVPGRVARDAPTVSDTQAGWAGQLRSLDLMRVNYGNLQTSGIDFDTALLVERDFATIELELGATWVAEYRSRDMNQALPVERVGIANLQGTIPKWRVVGSVGWTRGDFGISTTTTFTPSYQDADAWTGPLDRRLDSQTLVDLQTWIDLHGYALLEGSRLTFGAHNLFDQRPEFANAGGSAGYDMSQGTLTGRFLYVRANKRF